MDRLQFSFSYLFAFSDNTLQAQLRAASALRGLSVDEDLRTEIVARGGLVPLLRLSSNDDVEIQMEVRLQSGIAVTSLSPFVEIFGRGNVGYEHLIRPLTK